MEEPKQNPHPYTLEINDLHSSWNTHPESGLSSGEAQKRYREYGPNQLIKKDKKTLAKIVLEQFTTPIMYLLAGASALSFLFGDIPEGFAIVAVMLINAGIGFWMEYQARESMEALKKLDKLTAHVVRDGKEQTLDARQLVPGDLVIIEAGMMVPADLRLIDTSELHINESPLTGESIPVSKDTRPLDKDTPVAERTNMAFKGTSVARGKGRAIVTNTGMDTQIGNISQMVSSAGEDEIPLNRKLGDLSKRLIWLVLALAGLLVLTGIIANKDTYQIIQTSIAWAIAAIPEGLPIVASISLARGMLRLAKHDVIVKRLASVESLGETNTIFTDKTGTLTQNRLTVDNIFLGLNQENRVEWQDQKPRLEETIQDSPLFEKLFDVAVLANDATFVPDDESSTKGDPLEIALLRFTHSFDPGRMKELEALEFIGDDPFDSENMMMGTVHKGQQGYFVAAKGAPAALLECCSQRFENGKPTPLTGGDKETILQQSEGMSEQGWRTLALAFREDSRVPDGIDDQTFLHDLIYVGLIGFVDPPARGVKEAVETFHQAGIEVVMVTGDHPGTALNIAREVGLAGPGHSDVIHGSELTQKTKSEEEIAQTRIFARVDPSQKLELVESFQHQGKIVGMIGDGVNDAPAMKKADIGIAMGRRGTQVAKEVADMVLKNDAFPSILQAIREGRIIFGNIRKFIIYQLSYHLSEILVIALGMLLLFKLALMPLQLLYLNILLDVFPALALGLGHGRNAVMKEPPKEPDEDIITPRNWLAIIVYGISIAASVSAVYFWGHYEMELSDTATNNVAFFALAFAQLLNILNMRDPDEHVFVNQITRNKWVWRSVVFSFAALLAAYFIPGLKTILSLETMNTAAWWLVAIGALTPTLIIQVVKQWVKS